MNEHVKVLEELRDKWRAKVDRSLDLAKLEPAYADAHSIIARVYNMAAHELDAAIAALNPWQPIETAPKDGTRVLVCGTHWEDRQPIIAEWDPDYELWDTPYGVLLDEDLPDVWSPLPPPPAKESTNG